MKKPEHLDDLLLVKIIDGELSCDDSVAARAHLLACATCQARYTELNHLSLGVEAFVANIPVVEAGPARQQLSNLLFVRDLPGTTAPAATGTVFRTLGWTTAVAATLVAGIALAPHLQQFHKAKLPNPAQSQPLTYEVDGESFVALPYSNSDLPFTSSRIVEMQVPVSSLASAGMLFEPVASSSAADRTVLADVLLGADGQPLGFHLLSTE